jgi:hypothetical protein
MFYGIGTLFDFFLILIVDLIIQVSFVPNIQNWDGDCFKIYNFYTRYEGSGVVGIFLTLFVYFILMAINTILIYNYLIFVHMNGRLLDTYSRLQGNINHFFIPRDNEVSKEYVEWVIGKSRVKNHRVTVTKNTILDDKAKS